VVGEDLTRLIQVASVQVAVEQVALMGQYQAKTLAIRITLTNTENDCLSHVSTFPKLIFRGDGFVIISCWIRTVYELKSRVFKITYN
jgi:hypothetical protein